MARAGRDRVEGETTCVETKRTWGGRRGGTCICEVKEGNEGARKEKK